MNTATKNAPTTVKSASSYQPYFFNLFQNYCCGPKARAGVVPNNKEYIPIPEKFRNRAKEIVDRINKKIFERITIINRHTISIPSQLLTNEKSQEVFRYVIDRIVWRIMHEARVINWLSGSKVYPIRTSGNGNCLLHSILIAMVGIHDFDLIFRNHLIEFMRRNSFVLKKFWKSDRIRSDALHGIETDEKILDNEWIEVCNQVRHENSEDGEVATSLQFLESIHIFCIANMIARPIIVLSEDVVRNKYGEAISFNDLFGIYLPMLNDSSQCSKTPIVLAFDQSHFCPLLFEKSASSGGEDTDYVPLYQSESQAQLNRMLPIKFLNADPKERADYSYLDQYLNYVKMSYSYNGGTSTSDIYCAVVKQNTISDDFNFFSLYCDYIKDFYRIQKEMIQKERQDADCPPYVTTVPIQRVRVIPNGTMTDHSTTGSPPSYSSVVQAKDESILRNNGSLERRNSYERAVRNGVVTIPVEIKNSKSPSPPTPHTMANQILPNKNNLPRKIYGENQNQSISSNGLPNDGRNPNTNSVTGKQVEDSKLKQDSSMKFDHIYPPLNENYGISNDIDLIDFSKRDDIYKKCLRCKTQFEDLKHSNICPKCMEKKLYSNALPIRRSDVSTPIMVEPSTMGSRFARQSDFLSPRVSNISNNNRIKCRYCGTLNMLQTRLTDSTTKCSNCGRNLLERYN